MDIPETPYTFKPNNPFAAKAETARMRYRRLSRPSAHDTAMAHSFPLGGGYGRSGGARRLESRITNATQSVKAYEDACFWLHKAVAFEVGRITAQGRRNSPALEARSAKRKGYEESRQSRIDAAKMELQGKEPWEVAGDVWATAHGYFKGGGRDLMVSEHAEKVLMAVRGAKAVPEAVLEALPDWARAEL